MEESIQRWKSEKDYCGNDIRQMATALMIRDLNLNPQQYIIDVIEQIAKNLREKFILGLITEKGIEAPDEQLIETEINYSEETDNYQIDFYYNREKENK